MRSWPVTGTGQLSLLTQSVDRVPVRREVRKADRLDDVEYGQRDRDRRRLRHGV
jgi:hypothetical protein